ncbi:MAG TPA: rod shape-determining protein MreC [Patescibacteria group bacterium]|nr:rod shape-determining protein MreC [Patescibacteria group bacterium]
MTSLSSDRLARRRTILFGALLAISVLLMVVSSTGPAVELQRGVEFAFRPIQSGLDSIARGVSGMVETITEIDTLHRQNEQLAQENARLAAENARTKELERQNELLTALLEVKGSLGFDTVTGSVVGRESAQFRRVVTVDVGTDHGVKEGDVVVGAGGALVGRVTGVTGNSATILLINDTSSTVIGQLGTNQMTGSIIGQLGGVLIMENIDSAERLQIGDTVTTAGIDLGGGVRSPFPKGILVGSVVDVLRDANAVTQTAFIQPAADLERLEYVLIITDYQGGLPPIDQQPIPCASGGTLPEGEQPCVAATPKP